MAAPVSKFVFTPEGLTVQFQDRSLNTPTSWNWSFGDGDSSNDQNPSHTYTEAGNYTVSLTVTNGDGNDTHTYTIIISENPLRMSMPIRELIDCSLPSGAEMDENCKVAFIQKWQLILSTLVSPKIPNLHIFKESKWPSLANALIAQLVVWDYMLGGVGKKITGLQTTTSSSSSSGDIKSIQTEVDKVEYFDNSESLKSLVSGSDYFPQLRGLICTLASRIGVYLPFICGTNSGAKNRNKTLWIKVPKKPTIPK